MGSLYDSGSEYRSTETRDRSAREISSAAAASRSAAAAADRYSFSRPLHSASLALSRRCYVAQLAREHAPPAQDQEEHQEEQQQQQSGGGGDSRGGCRGRGDRGGRPAAAQPFAPALPARRARQQRSYDEDDDDDDDRGDDSEKSDVVANSRSIEALHLAKLLSGWTSSPLLIWGADLGRIRLPYRLFDVLI